jgi:hypothetical protein
MTSKQVLDMVYNKLMDDRVSIIKEWDKTIAEGKYDDAHVQSGKFQAINDIRSFIYNLYRSL